MKKKITILVTGLMSIVIMTLATIVIVKFGRPMVVRSKPADERIVAWVNKVIELEEAGQYDKLERYIYSVKGALIGEIEIDTQAKMVSAIRDRTNDGYDIFAYDPAAAKIHAEKYISANSKYIDKTTATTYILTGFSPLYNDPNLIQIAKKAPYRFLLYEYKDTRMIFLYKFGRPLQLCYQKGWNLIPEENKVMKESEK